MELRKELVKLENEEKSLLFIKDKSFTSQEEFDDFFAENKSQFERLKYIKNRIRDIKNLLMTPEEKEQRENYLNKLKDKFSKE